MDSIKQRSGQAPQLAPSPAQNMTSNLNQQVRKNSSNQQNLPQADGAPLRSRNQVGVKKTNSQGSNQTGGNGSQGGTFNENDTFNKHYNKELRVSKDEIPIVLGELNDSAIQFIKREQWEKALNLLQKAYGIMDVVDFNLCRRDKFNLFILFHNMALCYQKQQQLEECAQCIEQALEYIPADQFNLEEKSISNRMRKLYMLCKLKLQYCAILSQVHRHKDALEQSKEGVRISHHIINDLRQLCEFYVKREDIEQTYHGSVGGTNSVSQPHNSRNVAMANDSENMYNSYRSQRKERKFNGIGSRNRSFSQFLSQQEAYNSESSQLMLQQSSVSSNVRNSAFLLRPGNLVQENPQNQSTHNLSQFYSLNFLEESMSYIERTARKLMPILNEIKKRMVPEKTVREKTRRNTLAARGKGGVETLESVHEDMLTEEGDSTQEEKKSLADMKNILGYLNQGEWTTTLSIGSIMQLQALSMKDMLEQGKNELELNRESFISKVSMLAVAYFCYSTEIRFILQMKEDPTYEPGLKQKESEYWHAKSLEIACTFLPSECPLLSHINLSYQKHFAPVKQTIMEEETVTDDLKVVKPLFGVDNPKFQPIIRHLSNIQVAITPYQMTPLNQVTSQFLSQIQSFNDYQEQAQLSNIMPQSSLKSNTIGGGANLSQLHIKSKSGENLTGGHGIHTNHKRITTADQNQLQSRVLDTGSNSKLINQSTTKLNQNTASIGQVSQEDEDLQKFERLLDKLIRENKIDKLDLFKKLSGGQGGITGNILEERESYHSNDALMDEQIMAAADEEEDSQVADQIAEDEEHIGIGEAQRKTASNNLYKFRKPEADRPKTSNGNGRLQQSSQEHSQIPIEEKMSQMEKISQYHKHLEEKKKGQGRPLSGGLQQKIKSEGQKSRINKISNPHHNMSMYDKFTAGPNLVINGNSPERNISHIAQYNQSAGQKHIQGGQSQYLTQNQIIAQSKNQSASSHLQAAHQKLQVMPTNQTPFTQQSNNQNPGLQKVSIQPQQQNIGSSTIPDKKGGVDPANLQAYDELKKRLLNEYKKLTSGKKSFDEQVREKYKNLKQRAVSGKKTTSHHQIPNPTVLPSNNGPSVGNSSSQQQQYQINQVSPRQHINTYKPSFLLGDNNGGQIPNKEIEMIEQMNKKYRPSSKQGQPIQGIQQQPIMASGRSGSIGSSINSQMGLQSSQGNNTSLGMYHHDRNMSNNYPPSSQGLLSNQQILGLMIGNQDKKNQGSQQSTNAALQASNPKKAVLKSTPGQAIQHQDINYVKQFINDQKQQQSIVVASKQSNSSQPNLQQKVVANGSGYSTQQQFNQFQSFQGGMPQSHYIGNPGAHAYKMNPSSEPQPGKRSTSQNVGSGANNAVVMQSQNSSSQLKHLQGATSQQSQYEKLKKKLQNY